MVSDSAAPIQIEVIYAAPEHIWRRSLHLPAGATAQDAVQASGVLACYPDLQTRPAALGVFGRLCTEQHVLQSGDRLELYRPLVFDPMESRRRRQRHRQRKAQAVSPPDQSADR